MTPLPMRSGLLAHDRDLWVLVLRFVELDRMIRYRSLTGIRFVLRWPQELAEGVTEHVPAPPRGLPPPKKPST